MNKFKDYKTLAITGFSEEQANRIAAAINRKVPDSVLELTLIIADLGYNSSISCEGDTISILNIEVAERFQCPFA